LPDTPTNKIGCFWPDTDIGAGELAIAGCAAFHFNSRLRHSSSAARLRECRLGNFLLQRRKRLRKVMKIKQPATQQRQIPGENHSLPRGC
jgi:hypothetical protein